MHWKSAGIDDAILNKGLLITIDGPAGAGKTTVSRMLAQRLGYIYVDTGALYRGVAFETKARGILTDDDAALEKMCRGLDLAFRRTPAGLRLFANGRDITDFIRTPEITMLASAVSARPVVRRCLLDLQRALGRRKKAVFEGRDMGTVVFPEADVKFYLTASPVERARRRFNESEPGSASLAQVEKDLCRRDADDSSRAVAPLKPAPDAVLIDSTGIPAEEVVDLMLDHMERRIAGTAS